MMSLRRACVTAALCLLLGAVAGQPASAQTAPPAAQTSGPLQKADVEKIIKDYLMTHPEVLRDAMTELDNRDKAAEAESRKKALADSTAQLYDSLDGFVIGNPAGKVALVEFFDYNCGYCKRALSDLDRLMKDNKDLKVVLRDLPILAAESADASLVAVAAHNQFTGDKFWQYHRTLLGSHGVVGRERALAVAKDMGADMAKLTADSQNPEARKAVQQSLALAKSLSLNGTPSYVIGDDVLIGAVGYDQINATIGNVRKCGKAMCS